MRTILVFTDWYLPGYKAGGPITSCANIVEHLGDDFNFKIVCGDRDYLETEPYDGVKPNEWVRVGKAQVMYLSPESRSLNKIGAIIKEVKADMVYLNGMFSKCFTIFPLMALKSATADVAVAPRGMLAPAALGIKSIKKKTFLKFAKLFGLFSGVKFHATNSIESKQISSWFGKVPIEIVANIPGVSSKLIARSEHRKSKNTLRLYSVARIAPEKNIHFALECLQSIDKDISVSLEIIGAVYDQDYFSLCKKIVQGLPDNVEVSFLGAIPKKEIPQIASKADFFFLPTAGENYGHAIVEALLTGVPVIISSQTPWRNLKDAHLGFDLELINEEFSEILNQAGRLSNEDYKSEYKNITVNVGALINLDKLRNGYTYLFDFDDRNGS